MSVLGSYASGAARWMQICCGAPDDSIQYQPIRFVDRSAKIVSKAREHFFSKPAGTQQLLSLIGLIPAYWHWRGLPFDEETAEGRFFANCSFTANFIHTSSLWEKFAGMLQAPVPSSRCHTGNATFPERSLFRLAKVASWISAMAKSYEWFVTIEMFHMFLGATVAFAPAASLGLSAFPPVVVLYGAAAWFPSLNAIYLVASVILLSSTAVEEIGKWRVGIVCDKKSSGEGPEFAPMETIHKLQSLVTLVMFIAGVGGAVNRFTTIIPCITQQTSHLLKFAVGATTSIGSFVNQCLKFVEDASKPQPPPNK